MNVIRYLNAFCTCVYGIPDTQILCPGQAVLVLEYSTRKQGGDLFYYWRSDMHRFYLHHIPPIPLFGHKYFCLGRGLAGILYSTVGVGKKRKEDFSRSLGAQMCVQLLGYRPG